MSQSFIVFESHADTPAIICGSRCEAFFEHSIARP
jgi:hypothetical protein